MKGTPKFQVLIVDDEQVQREMLEGFLAKQGYGGETAGDGTQGLGRYKGSSFDLVLTDYRMPGMDGIQLLRELKRLNPEAVVVVDAALLVETGAHRRMDKLIVVTATEAQQVERLGRRTGAAPQEAQGILSAQMPLEEKLKVAVGLHHPQRGHAGRDDSAGERDLPAIEDGRPP